MRRTATVLVLSLLLRCAPAVAADELPAVVGYVAAHRESSPVASIPWERYRGGLRRLPIGVFDSGIGGLTVLEAILKLDAFDNATGAAGADGVPDFADERFVYLGDQANMPYGNYATHGRTDFLRECILRDVLFLLGDRYDGADGALRFDKPPVKAIVIACNTATAYGIDDVRTALAAWNVPIPVVGVVEAGARGALAAHAADAANGATAVLATVGTCAGGAYPRTIARWAEQAGRPAPTVCQRGCAGLAAAIEGLGGSVEACLREDVAALVEEYRATGAERPIRTVVLGCTHYPLIAAAVEREFQRVRLQRDATGAQPYFSLIAERLTFVDPGRWTADELFIALQQRQLRLGRGASSSVAGDYFFATVGKNGPFDDAYKFGRKPGRFDDVDVRTVPLTDDEGLRAAVEAWRKLLPHVAGRLPH